MNKKNTIKELEEYLSKRFTNLPTKAAVYPVCETEDGGTIVTNEDENTAYGVYIRDTKTGLKSHVRVFKRKRKAFNTAIQINEALEHLSTLTLLHITQNNR
jgi:uncharacterized protein YfcZ (UPF0381/DUF406 family)